MPVVTRENIELGLKDLGLDAGDMVLLHSSLASLGHVEGGADAVVDAFLSVLGPTGTLVVPTFGALGVITEVVRNRPDAVCSIHPKARVAAIGPAAERLCRDHWKAELAHGEDTPYVRIADEGGYVCLLGVDQDRNTTLHTVEELLRLPYLKETSEVTFETPEGQVTKSWPFFPGPHRDFLGLGAVLEQNGIVHTGRIGDATVRLMRSSELIEFSLDVGRRDPTFVLCDSPFCRDCVKQRAAIRAARFADESFRLSVSAQLAGHYAVEIADRCLALGIGAVELDGLQGWPLEKVPIAQIEAAMDAFSEAGLAVSALRLSAIPDTADNILQLAASRNVNRIVAPFVCGVGKFAEAAAAKNVTVSLINTNATSLQVRMALEKLQQKKSNTRLAFSPQAFAAVGENPFLKSYRSKLRRFMDQLYIEDVSFDGLPAPLGYGNAEIKEIISILRACNTPAWFVLASGNRAVGDLESAVEAFEELLRCI
ncbi:MAG: AAC(3) family N-acetyltransferase [Lentisphaeria bacterium]|nr:AAC(3) family N-acetyltransferase [Lentisphaeria bacterium]